MCCNSCIKSQKNESHPEWVSNIKPFINKYNWENIISIKKRRLKQIWKKIMQQLLLKFCILKKSKYFLPIFQKLTQIVKSLLMIPNVEKEGWHYLEVKNYLHYYME